MIARLLRFAPAALLFLLPAVAFAQDDMGGSMVMDNAVIGGRYLSLIAFAAATIIMWTVINRLGTSTLKSIFTYLFAGTAIMMAVTLFLGLGPDFFGIADASVDVWWHLLFYMAFGFYLVGLKLLVGLGDADTDPNKVIDTKSVQKWGILAFVAVILIFVLPHWSEGIVSYYTNSPLDSFGLHHFIAFAFAGFVAWYLFAAKKRLGMIGRTVANPIIVAVIALSLQHLWELLNESWKVIVVSDQVGEGVEKIFLFIAGVSIIYGGWKLMKIVAPAQASSTPATPATPAPTA